MEKRFRCSGGLVDKEGDFSLEGHTFESICHQMSLRCTEHGMVPTHCPLFTMVMGHNQRTVCVAVSAHVHTFTQTHFDQTTAQINSDLCSSDQKENKKHRTVLQHIDQ